MVITCDDSDLCNYLQNILGLRQTGDADIHADTKATAVIIQDASIGNAALASHLNGIDAEVGGMSNNLGNNTGNKSTVSDFLVDTLGSRNSLDGTIQANTHTTYTTITDGTNGNAAIKTAVNTVETHAAAIDTHLGSNVGNQSTISDYLVNVLGLRQSGQVDIHADTLAIAQILQLSGHGSHPVDGLLSALGYPNGSYATPAAQLNAINSALGTLAVNVVNLLGDMASVQTTLANVALGIVASWPKVGGLDLVQAIGDFFTAQRTGPGITHLTLGTATAIDETVIYTRPDAAYGLQLNLDVPGSWGRIDDVPNVYIPAVARLAQYSSFGTCGTPTPIEIEFLTVYPLHPACVQMQIKLGAGVTGTFAWLLLPA